MLVYMAKCQVIIHSWTFSGLVGAFLDLAIAYFLLCCSTIAYFVARFLDFLGLSLPCPCNGLFGYPSRAPCVQQLLVDYPTETVSNLQLSVKSRFPFDAVSARNDQCQLNLKLVKDGKLDGGQLEFDGDASYSSFSDPRRSQQSLSGSESYGKFDVKGKGVASQRQRSGSLRRRRRGSADYGKLTSVSSYDYMNSDALAIHRSPSVPVKVGNELSVEHSRPVYSYGRDLSEFDSYDAVDESKLMYSNGMSLENLKNNVHGMVVHGEDATAARILEQALEEEQAARMALYSELEQERIAAATAADEAMAMISRLQEEKAAVEMEARQYQRILEEKSSYDAEEMDILKEIIIRREREKHFLEKEVDAYRNLVQGTEELENQVDNVQEQNEASIFDLSVNPMLMLQQLSSSIDQRVINPDNASSSFGKYTSAPSSGKEPLISQWDTDATLVKEIESPSCSNVIPDHLHDISDDNQEIQEKGVLSVDENPYPQACKTTGSMSHEFLGNDTTLVGKQGQNDNVYSHQTVILGANTDGGEETIMQTAEPHVHDVHIVVSNIDKCDQTTRRGTGSLLMHINDSDGSRNRELPFEVSKELEINRTHSDGVDRLASVGSSSGLKVASELRRCSLPTVGHERLKIDCEIEWLRSRLKTVQEEKEKLTSSLDRQERGKAELQLLEDIASQIREIRHLTKPEIRQGSLPPLSSKVTSKKRRSRGISVGAGHTQSN